MSSNKEQTPVEQARNIGPVLAAEFSTFGVTTLEEVQEMGWEEFCIRYVEHFPERLHSIVFYAVAGATLNQKLEDLDSVIKLEARNLAKRLRKMRR